VNFVSPSITTSGNLVHQQQRILNQMIKPFEVYGIGQCCIDYIVKIDQYPAPNTKHEFSEMLIQGGGPVATALVALARWGISCTFCGVIGNDEFGRKIQQSFDDEGIDTSGLIVREKGHSQFAFILAEPGTGRRTIFWRRPTCQFPKADELNYDHIRNSKVIHTDGLLMDASLAVSKAAKEAGIMVVVDAGSLREGMIELARYSDYFIASEKFSTQYINGTSPIETCQKLAELGPKLTAVTLGERGYVAFCQGKIIQEPAYDANPVDTTGCGDVFHAGFIYGLIQEWRMEKCLDFSAWAAAMCSLRLGGRDGIPSVQDWKSRTENS
jgi:sulfofructose kinase